MSRSLREKEENNFIFESYAMFAKDHKKCRNNEKGRPTRRWCRQHMTEEGDIQINLLPWKASPIPLFRVHPDNTVTFVASVEQVVACSVTLSQSLAQLVPFHITRWKKGVYRIGGEAVAQSKIKDPNDKRYRWATEKWGYLQNEAPQYFAGIKFDMATGECLNPMPDTVREVVPEKRTEWLRCLRRYKKGLKSRIKVGALTEYATLTMEVRNAGGYGAGGTHWAQGKLTDLMYCMVNEHYPPEMLTNFVRSVPRTWRQTEITPADITKAVEQVFTHYSEALREEYGVFGEVLHKKE
jgi:hypothetical protein